MRALEQAGALLVAADQVGGRREEHEVVGLERRRLVGGGERRDRVRPGVPSVGLAAASRMSAAADMAFAADGTEGCKAAAHDPRPPLALEPHPHALRRLHGPRARRPASSPAGAWSTSTRARCSTASTSRSSRGGSRCSATPPTRAGRRRACSTPTGPFSCPGSSTPTCTWSRRWSPWRASPRRSCRTAPRPCSSTTTRSPTSSGSTASAGCSRRAAGCSSRSCSPSRPACRRCPASRTPGRRSRPTTSARRLSGRASPAWGR